MSESLKPCPACGAAAAVGSSAALPGHYIVNVSHADNCLLNSLCPTYYLSMEAAIAAWSARPIEDSLRAELDHAGARIRQLEPYEHELNRTITKGMGYAFGMGAEETGAAIRIRLHDNARDIAALRAELAEARGRWISTSERLPEVGDLVLIAMWPLGSYDLARLTFVTAGAPLEWVIVGAGRVIARYDFDQPSHWMKLTPPAEPDARGTTGE